MSYISYDTQFLILSTSIIFAIVISTKLLLKNVDSWYRDESKEKFTDLTRLQKIREKCFSLPYTVFVIELLVPSTVAFLILSITGSHSPIMIGKIILLLMSFSMLLAVVSFIFSKDIYDELLSKTYVEGFDIGMRINMKSRIFLLISPIILASILMTALIGYSFSIKEKEEALFYSYNNHINNYFDASKLYSYGEIYQILLTMDTISDNDTVFIISEDGTARIPKGKKISHFIIEYTLQLSEANNGRIYDSYGVDTQGSSIALSTPSGEKYYVGLLYEVFAKNSFSALIITAAFLISVSLVILYIFATSLTNNIQKITIK